MMGTQKPNCCRKCGQPLPQIMPCEEWEKAKIDFIRQFNQKGGFIKAGGLFNTK